MMKMQPMQISTEDSTRSTRNKKHRRDGSGSLFSSLFATWWHRFRFWTTTTTATTASRSRSGTTTTIRACLVVSVVILLLFFRVTRGRLGRKDQHPPTPANRDRFADTPFCDANGTCHELPDQPSPRTVYSARNAKQYEKWWKFHAVLNQTAAASEFDDSDHPLVLLGDSITEAWAGTSLGAPLTRAKGVPKVLQTWIQSSSIPWKPLVLGISGDQTQHLLWRLQHGELTTPVASHTKALFVVLIGINNLGSGELPGPTARGILAVLDYLMAHVQGRVLCLYLLPRGNDQAQLAKLCPPRCDSHGQPFISFLPAIEKVNQAVQQGIQERFVSDPNLKQQLALLDCGQPFLLEHSSPGNEVNVSIMPDRLHPNAEGHALLASCISSWVQENLL